MVSRLLAVSFDAHDASRLAQFWAGLLERKTVEDTGGVVVPGQDPQVSLRFVAAPSSWPIPMATNST